jgi:hypothetical protein
MPLIFRCFKNKNTGQVCYLPAGRYGNFLNSVRKIVNYVHYNYQKYYVVHLTLTVAENLSDVSCDHLHRVDTFIQQRLKRAGAEGKRIAVKEFQERGAVHFHVLYIYNKAYVFPNREDVAKSWGLGFVDISAPKIRVKLGKIIGYIGKYIGKGYEYETLNFKKSFTASQIKQIYKLAPSRLNSVMTKYGKDKAETLKCTYRKVYEMFDNGLRVVKRLIEEFPSEWSYEGVFNEPF